MKRMSSIVIAGLLVAIVAACTGPSGGLGQVPSPIPTGSSAPGGPDLTPTPSDPTPSEEPGSTPTTTPTPSGSPSATTIVRAYFVLGGDQRSTGLVPVLRVIPETTAVATAAMNAVLSGPSASESGDKVSSAIPSGSRLLGLTIRNGIATVDLSTEFDSGGGSASMQYRLAQVVYTLTQFSTVKSVIFQVEGQTVTVFGGEGIVLDGPVGRADFTDQLPSVFVDRPAFGAAFASGGHVTGNADVFEAAFLIAVLDGSGKKLADEQVMATCGTGCRGTFDVTIQYTVSKAQWGTLRAYNLSAKDGSVEDVRDYPVWLTPAN